MKPRLRPLETLRLIRHGLIPGVAWKLESLRLDTWDLENEAAWHLLPQKKPGNITQLESYPLTTSTVASVIHVRLLVTAHNVV